MTRIFAVSPDEAGPLFKLSYWYTRRRFGEVPEPFAVTANHRKLFVAYLTAETVAGKASTVLPANVRDLAVYRVAWMVGSSWCVDFGTMLHRLKEIGDYATSPVYTDDERGHRLRHDRNADGGDRRAGRRPGAAGPTSKVRRLALGRTGADGRMTKGSAGAKATAEGERRRWNNRR